MSEDGMAIKVARFRHARDRSELARLMLDWEDLRRRLDDLGAVIEASVLELGETVTTGNVRASYSAGRKRYDYKAACGDEPDPYLVEQFSTKKIDWRKLALDGIGLDKDEIPHTQSEPSVSLKLED